MTSSLEPNVLPTRTSSNRSKQIEVSKCKVETIKGMLQNSPFQFKDREHCVSGHMRARIYLQKNGRNFDFFRLFRMDFLPNPTVNLSNTYHLQWASMLGNRCVEHPVYPERMKPKFFLLKKLILFRFGVEVCRHCIHALLFCRFNSVPKFYQ